MNKKMKIAIVNVFFPPYSIGGATRVVADNVESLLNNHRNEFEVVVFSSHPDHEEDYVLHSYAHRGCRVYSLTTKLIHNLEWNAENDAVEKAFKQFLEFETPDLIHFHCVQRLTASMLKAAQKLGTPYIVTVHDAWWISDYQFLVDKQGQVYANGHEDSLSIPKPPSGISEVESLQRRMKLKTLLHGAKKILAVSDSFTDLYKRNGFANCETSKNGLSSGMKWQPKSTKSKENLVLGHLGGMSNHKGYDLLKTCISSLNLDSVELIIADHSKGPDYVRKSMWGSSMVTFIGRQAQDSMVEIYKSIDVLVAASIWPESFGLVSREALACGCWVVASDIGGIGEDIDEGVNGHKVKAGSMDDLKRVIQMMANNPSKYKELSKSKALRSSDEQVEELVKHHYQV
jgi:glycosyltransferase involved in cell wall biosynthesis